MSTTTRHPAGMEKLPTRKYRYRPYLGTLLDQLHERLEQGLLQEHHLVPHVEGDVQHRLEGVRAGKRQLLQHRLAAAVDGMSSVVAGLPGAVGAYGAEGEGHPVRATLGQPPEDAVSERPVPRDKLEEEAPAERAHAEPAAQTGTAEAQVALPAEWHKLVGRLGRLLAAHLAHQHARNFEVQEEFNVASFLVDEYLVEESGVPKVSKVKTRTHNCLPKPSATFRELSRTDWRHLLGLSGRLLLTMLYTTTSVPACSLIVKGCEDSVVSKHTCLN